MKKIMVLFILLLCMGCSSTSRRDSKISKYFTFKEATDSAIARNGVIIF